MQKEEVTKLLTEAENHLTNELLPFWITRMIDSANGVQPATSSYNIIRTILNHILEKF